MRQAAESLEFEKAAALRDQIFEMREALVEKQDLPPWKRAKALAAEDPLIDFMPENGGN
jgi:excinuclease ABC subunit B